ncbi:MAG TPA: hypothetical protein VFR49_04390, partial [Solirubrobacteraceae bacterium]|nr:hypothetical protein [Solirubrobacteraceae bacterium]
VVQRATVDLRAFTGSQHRDFGSKTVPAGGRGGVDHAEQEAWNQAFRPFENYATAVRAPVQLEFTVDTKVCPACQRWFMGTFWNQIDRMSKRTGSAITVAISVKQPRGYAGLMLNGPATVWSPLVGDA